jgi:hypothetical protein
MRLAERGVAVVLAVAAGIITSIALLVAALFAGSWLLAKSPTEHALHGVRAMVPAGSGVRVRACREVGHDSEGALGRPCAYPSDQAIPYSRPTGG